MKKHIIQSFTVIGCLLFTAATIAQEPIKINTQESKIIWKGKNPTREHTGYIKLSQGELLVENNNVKGGSFIVDMNSITNVDLTNKESNQKLVNHLKSKDFFDVEKFPKANFVITNISAISNNGISEKKATHRIDGDLTIKSITKKVSFDASINMLNGKFAASTPEFTINRTEWDVNYQSKSVVAGLKDQFIYDDITLSIELVSR
jgi:polyisoprenoid-binding protein YceI